MFANKALTLAIVALAASVPALADDVLEIRTTVEKIETVVDQNGQEVTRLVPADTVVPGEVVTYTVSFRNVGTAPAENVVITNPLPAELTYVAGSADGDETRVEFSADGGQSYAAADALTVADAGGERPAAPEDFTHIRWVLGRVIEPGAGGSAGFRARLN